MDNKTKICPFIKAPCIPEHCGFGVETKNGRVCVFRHVAEELREARKNKEEQIWESLS